MIIFCTKIFWTVPCGCCCTSEQIHHPWEMLQHHLCSIYLHIYWCICDSEVWQNFQNLLPSLEEAPLEWLFCTNVDCWELALCWRIFIQNIFLTNWRWCSVDLYLRIVVNDSKDWHKLIRFESTPIVPNGPMFLCKVDYTLYFVPNLI